MSLEFCLDFLTDKEAEGNLEALFTFYFLTRETHQLCHWAVSNVWFSVLENAAGESVYAKTGRAATHMQLQAATSRLDSMKHKVSSLGSVEI